MILTCVVIIKVCCIIDDLSNFLNCLYFHSEKLEKLATMPAAGPEPEPTLATAEPTTQFVNDPLFDPWCDPKNPRSVQFQVSIFPLV